MASESILLVDDSTTNLQLLYQLLDNSVGCMLLVAKNGETARTIRRGRLCRQMEGPDADEPAAVISSIMQGLRALSGGRAADDDQTLEMAFIE